MIHPYLTNGRMLWGSASKQQLHKIEVLPKKPFEIYTRLGTTNTECHYFTRVKYLFKKKDLYKLQLLIFIYG